MKSQLAALALMLPLAFAPSLALAQYLDLNDILGGIGNASFQDAASIADEAASVQVVRMSKLSPFPQDALRARRAEDQKQTAIAHLQGQLWSNPVARAAIKNSGVTLDQIVSAQAFGDTSIVIFADDL